VTTDPDHDTRDITPALAERRPDSRRPPVEFDPWVYFPDVPTRHRAGDVLAETYARHERDRIAWMTWRLERERLASCPST
jgi:hypothetical protein